MAGLIDEQVPGAPSEEAPQTSDTPPQEDAGDKLSPEKVSGQIKMPPELQNAYERVVVAGMKVMFDKTSHQSAVQQLQGAGPVSERLGKAIAGLMVLLFKQSNQTMPPQVIIPAGTDLLIRAADFLKKSGTEQVTDQDIGEALSIMIETVLTKFGIDPMKVLNSYDGSQVPAQGAGLVDQAAGAPAAPVSPAGESPAPSETPPVDDAENPVEEAAPDEEKE